MLVLSAAARVGAAPGTPAPQPTRAAGANPSVLGALSFSTRRDPISITADTLEFDYKTRLLTYRGRVEVTQADIKLNANTLMITLQDQGDNQLKQSDNQVKEIVAEGQVRVAQGTRWATGGRAVFDQANHTVVLSQNAVVHDGPNEVSGDRIVVYLDQERSIVESGGGGRVKALLFPSKGAGGDDDGTRR